MLTSSQMEQAIINALKDGTRKIKAYAYWSSFVVEIPIYELEGLENVVKTPEDQKPFKLIITKKKQGFEYTVGEPHGDYTLVEIVSPTDRGASTIITEHNNIEYLLNNFCEIAKVLTEGYIKALRNEICSLEKRLEFKQNVLKTLKSN